MRDENLLNFLYEAAKTASIKSRELKIAEELKNNSSELKGGAT